MREGVGPASLQVDDVIELRQGEHLHLRLIVAIEESVHRPADCLDTPDRPVTGDRIRRKVVSLIPEVVRINLRLMAR